MKSETQVRKRLFLESDFGGADRECVRGNIRKLVILVMTDRL